MEEHKYLKYRTTVKVKEYDSSEILDAVFLSFVAGGSDTECGVYECEMKDGVIKRFKELEDVQN